MLGQISGSIHVGPPALLAEVSEDSPASVDAAMADLRGELLRRPVEDVEAEIAAAEHAQREAKQKARKELRDGRRRQRKDEIDAKVAALKAKLPSRKHVAA